MLKHKTECRAITIGAVHLHGAAHHSQQIQGYGHTKARAFNIAITFFLNPFKFSEQFLHVLFFYANTCILHSHSQVYTVRFIRNSVIAHIERHCSLFRVFHGIGQHICNYLLNADLIAKQNARHFFIKP